MKPEKRRMNKINEFAFGFDPSFVQDVIHSHPLFRELAEEDILQIMLKCPLVELSKDSVLFTKNEAAEGIHVIVEGVLRKEFSPENSFLIFLGTILGANSIYTGNNYMFSVRCESNCKLIFIKKDLIMKFLNKYANFEKNLALLSFNHFLESKVSQKKILDVVSLDRQFRQNIEGHKTNRA